jgi:hypothetical protein
MVHWLGVHLRLIRLAKAGWAGQPWFNKPVSGTGSVLSTRIAQGEQ